MNPQAQQALNVLETDHRYWPCGLLFTTKGVTRFIADLARYTEVGQKALDLGCSRAVPYKAYMEALGLHWYGADIYTQTEPPQEHYRQIVDNHIDFPDDTFDAICTFHVIEHFTHPEAMFQEIARCLKPGGIFCGSCAFWEKEHQSFFHLSNLGLIQLLNRHGFDVIYTKPSQFSGVVANSQRFFGGDGQVHTETLSLLVKSVVVGSLNWIPFLLINALEGIRRTVFRPWFDAFKDCATLYFYARKR